MPDIGQDIAAMRRFSRFYTRQVGLLEDVLLKSPYSLSEARIIFEIANGTDVSASDLTRDLGIDPGYLSRLLSGMEKAGVIRRNPSRTDARRQILTLTEFGQQEFVRLDAASADQISGLLHALTERQRRDLVTSMASIETLLRGGSGSAEAIVLRPQRPGDLGTVVHLHGRLYAEEYGFDESFEALVAEIVAGFARNFDSRKERCWIAERDGTVVGSVFLVRQDDEIAKLRLLIVGPEARGTGLGKRLVAECIAFARACGYRKLVLWTNGNLHAAIAIYRNAGFRLVEEEKHHSFGQDLVGQNWELDL